MENSRRRWVFWRGSSSNTSDQRRRRVFEENQTTFTPVMLHVSEDFEAHTIACSSCRTLRRVTDDEVYLRDVDLFLMHTSNWDEVFLQNYRLTCHHRGNISALFLQECSEFFFEGNLENGLSMIRECAIRPYELAIYAYSMLRRIMNPHLGLDLELMYPDHNLVRRMRQRVKDCRNNYWGPEAMPQLYRERVRNFDYHMIYNCRCAMLDLWVPIHAEAVKGPEMCDLCFTTIHAIAFNRYFTSKIHRWPFSYHF